MGKSLTIYPSTQWRYDTLVYSTMKVTWSARDGHVMVVWWSCDHHVNPGASGHQVFFPDDIPTRECRAVNSEYIGQVVSFLNAAGSKAKTALGDTVCEGNIRACNTFLTTG